MTTLVFYFEVVFLFDLDMQQHIHDTCLAYWRWLNMELDVLDYTEIWV